MRRSVMLLVSVASAVLLACGAAWAAAGDLDPTFGDGDGQVVGETATCPVDDLAVFPEGGKILSFGEYCGRLHRYDPDGSPYETFGGDGTVTYGYEGTDYPINITPLAFLAQPDGGIVVGGYAYGENRDPQFTLARFLPDGTPDATFGGGDGKLTANLGTYGSAKNLAVLPDGRLMVAGYAGYVNDFMLARFRPDGAIDKSFGGGDGKLRTGFAEGTNDFGWSLVVKGSRAILAGATYADTKDAPGRFALVAYAEDGSLLKSFGGGDGKVKTVFGVGDAFARDAVVQEDGKLLVVGQRNKFLKGWRGIDFALARYEPDGTLDASFGGGDGKLVTDVSPGMDDSAEAVAVDAEGRAVVGGQAIAHNSSTDRYETASGLARYLLE